MNENLLIVEDEFIVANDLRNILENAGYLVCDIADSVETAILSIEKYKPTWVLLDIFLQDGSMGTEIAPYLDRKGIGYIYISANTNPSVLEAVNATKPYGFLIKPFREKDLLIMLDIARGKHETNIQFTLQREQMLIHHVKSIVEGQGTFETKLMQVPGAFQLLVPSDLLCYQYVPPGGKISKSGGFYRTGYDEYQLISSKQLYMAEPYAPKGTGAEGPEENCEVKLFTAYAFQSLLENRKDIAQLTNHYQLNALLEFNYASPAGILRLFFYNRHNSAFDQTHVSILCKLDKVIYNLFSHISTLGDGNRPKIFSAPANVESSDVRKTAPRFEGIYGSSPALLQVLDNIELVADTPVSVLIQGESGTGKEKVAYNIHHLSKRRQAPFVTVNCAAIPFELIESELFGHEKGAFTGAVEKRIGKFEIASGGTLFLDEIGEMPLASQVKLLRVLQEKQFERIGSSKTITVDTRVVAATNRNLEEEVSKGNFRLDLFYRLNVFPIYVPPLRERKEDIPLLAKHFLTKCSQKIGREGAAGLSASAQKQLMAYHWPGNIRELENLIERSLIRSKTDVIDKIEMPANVKTSARVQTNENGLKTLEEMEAEHILAVLRNCNGKVFGSGGAAEILGLPSSTLTSRMKKLGIRKRLDFGQ